MRGSWAQGGRLARWVVRDTVPRLSRALAPAWIALALAVVQVDASVHWPTARAQLREVSAGARWGLGFGLVALWAVSLAWPLRQALRQPRDRWRWRLPLGPGALAVGLAPAWLPAVAPLLGPGWLLDRPLALAAAAVGPSLCLAAGRWGGAATALGLGAVLLALPLPEVLWAILGGMGAWWGCRALGSAPPAMASSRRGGRAWRAWGPRTALLQRDLRALWRLERGLVWAALLSPAPAYAVQHTAVSNLPLHGEAAVHGGLLVLCLLGTAATGAVLALPHRLGPVLDPRGLPLSAFVRGGLLAGVGGLLAAPTAAAVGLGGCPSVVRLGLHIVALAAGAAWFGVGVGRRTGADRGSFLWWLLLLCGLAFAPAPWGPALVSAAAGLALWGTAHTLAEARRRP